MPESKTINRRKASNNPYSFESLRREGIRYTQEFSGDIWTDYNVHDPGVTILEQLCYGLTDLIYRTDFNVEDYLVNKLGQLDLDYLGLVPAEKILPCRPSTLSDYRQAILDAVNEIERLWIRQSNTDITSLQGLYVIDIELSDDVRKRSQSRPALKQRVIDKVLRIYAKLRNLCEDLIEVNIIDEQGYQLNADINIQENVDPDDMLAEIYFTVDQWFKGRSTNEIAVENYEDQIRAGKSLDQILTGPETLYGQIKDKKDNDFSEHQHNLKAISTLHATILGITGVNRINALTLVPAVNNQEKSKSTSEKPTPAITQVSEHAWFHLPQSLADLQVKLKRNGHTTPVDYANVIVRFEQKAFKQNMVRYTRQEKTSLYQLPTGNYRQLQEYHSIQHHFPISYNLTVQGVSNSVGLQDFAKVQQLRGYLLVFEQFMANFTANLAGVRQLFSADISQTQSYRFQLIDGQSIKGIEQLYAESPQSNFETIREKFDPFVERKSRLFDYLLALYGEDYQLSIMSKFNYYHRDTALQSTILKYKYDYLKLMMTISKDRGGAFDYSRLSHSIKNKGGFVQRLSFQLAMAESVDGPYTKILLKLPLKLVADDQYKTKKLYLNDEQLNTLISIPVISQSLDLASINQVKMIKTLVPLRHSILGESLFRHGMDLSCYKMLPQEDQQGFDVLFQPKVVADDTQQCQPWFYIANASTELKAAKFLDFFSKYINQLNQRSEGLHVVEHILLRSDNQQTNSNTTHIETTSIESDHYSFQVSIVMPAYTARCYNTAFRTQAEAIIHENCPAHILPQCLWLNFEAMCEFETLYFTWLEQRRSSITPCQESIVAGEQLMTFLQYHSNEQCI